MFVRQTSLRTTKKHLTFQVSQLVTYKASYDLATGILFTIGKKMMEKEIWVDANVGKAN